MSHSGHRPLRTAQWGLLFTLLVAPYTFAAEQRAEVSIGTGPAVNPTDTVWTGEQVTLNLDLKTPALSFADIHFNLPEVPGALVLRTDTTTVKLTERRAGEAWQVLRYPITLFPQQAGTVTVPAFEVRFETLEGFGSTPVAHRLETEPLTLEVRQPPGLASGQVAVTTPRLQLTSNWEVPDGDLKAGDALTLTVERQAAGLSAMLLPPLPVAELDGLAAYPAEPDIDDRTNRGSLTGVRRDRVTWVIEQAGEYTLPTIAFRSWDPNREQLETQRVEGVSFEAGPAPGQPVAVAAQSDGAATDLDFRRLLVLAFPLLIAGLLLWRGRARIQRLVKALRVRILPPARALLRSLNPGAPS